MTINATMYVPAPWHALDAGLQRKFEATNELLARALHHGQPTYDELDRFRFGRIGPLRIRPEITRLLPNRASHSYTMTHEIGCFRKAMHHQLYQETDSIYQSACRARQLLFGGTEPLRTYDMMIVNHPWMRIKPPCPDNPVFSSPAGGKGAPVLYGALNIYLILLAAHPFSDGNGRTSRIMFNLHLGHHWHNPTHYVPIAELTRATGGAYEELIVRASKSGKYLQLINHMLNLLNAYARFVLKPQAPGAGQVLALLPDEENRIRATPRQPINDSAPYIVSFKSVIDRIDAPNLDSEFVTTIAAATDALSPYGRIEYALLQLRDLIVKPGARVRPILFYVHPTNKDELVLHFREIRARFRKALNLQIVLDTNSPVENAKVLSNLLIDYSVDSAGQVHDTVLLHDFGAPPAPPG